MTRKVAEKVSALLIRSAGVSADKQAILLYGMELIISHENTKEFTLYGEYAMENTTRKKFVLLLLLTMILTCPGCTTSTEKLITVEFENAAHLVAATYNFDVGELFDICEDEKGFLIASESGAYLLTADFTIDGTAALEDKAVCFSGKAGVYAAIAENETELSVCDAAGERYRIPMGVNSFGQLLMRGETIWFCDGDRLLRNKTQIELPQGGDGRWQASALIEAENSLFVLLRKFVGEGEASDGLLVPITEDATAIRTQEGLALPDQLRDVLPYCIPESSCVYAGGSVWKTDGEHFTLLADLQASGVNTAKLRRVLVLEDGRILCLQQDCLLVLSSESPENAQADSGEHTTAVPAERTVLRLGALYSAFEFSDMISYVNLHSTACRLEVKEYGSIDQLNRALLSGEVDILALPDLSAMKNYAAKDLLTPMETVAPTLFSSGVLYENMVEALHTGKGCCCLPLVMQPQVNVVPKRYQATASDLATPQAYFSFLAEHEPEAFGWDTRDIRFSNWLTATAEYWLDSENGTASFQTQEFLELLEYCDRFVLTSAEAMANRSADDEKPRASCNQPVFLGRTLWEDYDFVSPPFTGVSACTLHSNTYLAVVSGCDTDVAGALITMLFTDEGWHDTWRSSGMTRLCISINREWTEGDLDAEAAQMLDDTYTEIEDEESFLAGVLQMKALYSAANHFAGGISELNNVIIEEAQVYFNGDCTAHQAAERIENRVWLYINEHN